MVGVSGESTTKSFARGALEVILVGVVINRACGGSQTRDGGLEMQPVENVAETRDDMDWRFVTVIAIVPSAGIFYSLFRTFPATKVCEPLPLSWLRMKRNLKFSSTAASSDAFGLADFPSLFASGGYVKTVLQDQIFRLQIQMRLEGVSSGVAAKSMDVEVIRCLQVPLSESPGLHPDAYVTPDGAIDYVSRVGPTARVAFDKAKKDSNNFGKGRRNYVAGALYESLPGNCLILDVKPEGGSKHFDLHVGVQRNLGSTQFAILEESIVEVRYEPTESSPSLDPLQIVCNEATEQVSATRFGRTEMWVGCLRLDRSMMCTSLK